MLQRLFWERNELCQSSNYDDAAYFRSSAKVKRLHPCPSIHHPSSGGRMGRRHVGPPCCCSSIRGTRHGRRRAHSEGIRSRRRVSMMGLQELHNIHTIPRARAIIITTNMLLQAACLHFPVMCNAVSSLMRAFSAALAATFPLFFHLLSPYKVPPCLASSPHHSEIAACWRSTDVSWWRVQLQHVPGNDGGGVGIGPWGGGWGGGVVFPCECERGVG